jgi:hypothetical protein
MVGIHIKTKRKHMGLMDRDYMNEKRPRQAFTPAAEKSAVSTLFMVLVFVAALFLLYKLADWQLNKRASGFAAQSAPWVQPTPHQAPPRQEASPPPHERESRTYPEAPEPAAGNRVVTKCIVNGKTSYGDGPCSGGAVTTQVTTRADHNIMAPVRVAATGTTETSYSPAPVAVAQNTAPSDYAAKKLECQSLEAHIQQLDSMSRQPQSGQMMDWIRDERKKARDRQFRIPCR